MTKINNWIEGLDNQDLSKFLIRLALGIVFIYAGWFKLGNMEMVITGFTAGGFPVWTAYLVAYAELISGILMVLGFWVRHAGIVIAIIMIVAMFKVHWVNGFSLANGGYEYVLVLLLAALAVVTMGPGKHTLHRWLKK